MDASTIWSLNERKQKGRVTTDAEANVRNLGENNAASPHGANEV